jgi:hypothetical protein
MPRGFKAAPMTGILDRIARLVALTDNPNENEARNAAAKACALIREHGLQVAPPRSGDPFGMRALFPLVQENLQLTNEVRRVRALLAYEVHAHDHLREEHDALRAELHAAHVAEFERVNAEERDREAAE